jgi:hypothetical protein
VNGKAVICPKYVMANHKLVSDTYSIQSGDVLEIINYYTLEQLLTFMDLPYHEGIEVNHMSADKDCKVYENFTVDYPLHHEEEESVTQEQENVQEVTITKDENMQVSVNGVPTFISKKPKNILVDILDVYPFDLTVAKGSTVVIKRNGETADFTTPIMEFDKIELYWD